MGLLKIKYIDATPIVQHLSVPIDLSAGLPLRFILPDKDNETVYIDYTIGTGRLGATGIKVDIFEQFKDKGYLIGNLTSDSATVMKIQDTDLSRGGRVYIYRADVAEEAQVTSGITNEIEDASANDYDHVDFNDIAQAYDEGKTIAIPHGKIFKIERSTIGTIDQIRLYYKDTNISGFNCITFTAGTIDITKINQRKGLNTSLAVVDIALTASSFVYTPALDILEDILYQAMVNAEGKGIYTLDYDTENITVEITTG